MQEPKDFAKGLVAFCVVAIVVGLVCVFLFAK
jgi:hypothetical protein